MATLGRFLVPLLTLSLGGVLHADDAARLTVKRVVDGDTLVLSNNERVRLIGVDTPEYHASDKLRRDARASGKDAAAIRELGSQASAFTKSMAAGRRVKLAFDQANAAVNHRDRYGRLLAYVYFVEGPEHDLQQIARTGAPVPEPLAGVAALKTYKEGFLNGLLVEAGYGHAYTRYPFQFKDEFLTYERAARQTGRGLWRQ